MQNAEFESELSKFETRENSAETRCSGYLAVPGDPELPGGLGARQAPPEDAVELLGVHVDRLVGGERRRQEHPPVLHFVNGETSQHI